MRLVDSSLSLTAAFASCQTLFRPASSSGVATVVDMAYESQSKHLDHSKSLTLSEECSFSKSHYLKGGAPDTGILGCNDPEYICIEDSLSSLGGRCASPAVAHRELQKPPPCTVKCTGTDACTGSLNPNNIGIGSCCGTKACFGVSESSIIGDGSCIGYKACYKAQDATIGDGSCTGDSIKSSYGNYGISCEYLKGTVGDNSCYEYAACYQKSKDGGIFNIGDNSCRGQESCEYTGNYKIGDKSCNEYYACYKSYAAVGIGSCNAQEACKNNAAPIGDYVCCTSLYVATTAPTKALATNAPAKAPTKVPTKKPTTSAPSTQKPTPITSSPTKSPAKKPTSNPTKKPTISPTKKPTSSPTKKPTSSPTKKPTSNPTKKPTSSPTKKPTSSPTKKPTSSPTKNRTSNPTKKPTNSINPPTYKPTTVAPTSQPTRISTTLLFSVDLCYPGCGNFSAVDSNKEFEGLIQKYTPCSAMQCVVNIVDSLSSPCATCSLSSPGRLRFLVDSSYKSSSVIFEIVSDTPLNEQVVGANLNSNIANANSDLSGSNSLFRLDSNFIAVVQLTHKPSTLTQKPMNAKSSKEPTSPSTKPDSKSSKNNKSHKDSKKING